MSPFSKIESPGTCAESKPGGLRWAILALLFAAATVNYMDRFILGVMKPVIMREMKWDESGYANIVACFQAAYAIGLLVTGRIIDFVGVRVGLAMVIGACGLAAASHSLAASLTGFCLARLALGFAESGTWPGCAKAVSEWFPRKERAIAMGVVNAGSSIGATVTPVIVSLGLRVVAWPLVFLVTALLDMLLLIVWCAAYRSPAEHRWLKKSERDYIHGDPVVPREKVAWLRLFRHRQTWAFLIAKGLSDPVWWFYLFWMPGFLSDRYGSGKGDATATVVSVAGPVIVIYLMADLGSLSGGWLSKKLIDRGWSFNAARKAVMLGCAVCVMPISFAAMEIGLWPSVLLIGLAAAAHLAFSANLFTIATDTVPPSAVGSVAAIGGFAAALGGMVMAKMVGFVLDTAHSYTFPFLLASIVYLLALGLLQWLLPNMEVMEPGQIGFLQTKARNGYSDSSRETHGKRRRE